jgi:DNA-binding FadR family transcriptional regulator
MTLADQNDSGPPTARGYWRDRQSGGIQSAPPKMAEELAYRLESLVMERGWPVGTILGSEPELIERFGVSRAVFREAVRIVEHHGAARMRRGPNGGLVVTAPDFRAVQRPTTLYLDYAQVSTADLFTVRTTLEATCVELLAADPSESSSDRLRAALHREATVGEDGMRLGAPYDLHVLIAELTGNAALLLFVETLARLGFERSHDIDMPADDQSDQLHAHTLIVEAITAGDGALAKRRMETHLAAAALRYP